MPKRSGTPSTRSMPLICSVKIFSMVSGRSRRTPSAWPPRATTDMTRATERALPRPLTDQVPVVQRVVTRRGARLPPRSLGRHPRRRRRPVVEILHDGRLLEPGDPGGMRHQMADQDAFLAARGELRPVPGDRGVYVQL